MTEILTPLQEAAFDRFQHSTLCSKLAELYKLDKCTIRRAFNKWINTPPESQPTDATDVHLVCRSPLPSRPQTLHQDEKCLVLEAIRLHHYVEHNTPLTKKLLLYLVEHYVGMLLRTRQREISFTNNRPSLQWIDSFTGRHNLAYKALRVIDDKPAEALTKAIVCEHNARVKVALKRYNIKAARYTFNMDQSGVSFSKMTGKSLRKGIGPRDATLIHTALRTKGNVERVSYCYAGVICSTCGIHSFCCLFWCTGSFSSCEGTDTNTTCFHAPMLPLSTRSSWRGLCHHLRLGREIRHRDPTTSLRSKYQYILLVIDGYGSHVQFKTLHLFKDNRIIVITMPSHTSHVLQPLDVIVFSSYKSYLEKEVHYLASREKVLDAFDIACCINNAYTASHTARNIVNGFRRTGLWDDSLMDATVEPLNTCLLRRKANLEMLILIYRTWYSHLPGKEEVY